MASKVTPLHSGTLHDDLNQAVSDIRVNGSTCSFVEVMASLEPPDREALNQALNEPGKYPGTAIAAALRKRGFAVKASTVQRHRRGLCSCQ